MGRIKTQQIKSVTQDLFERYGEEFTTDFEENKKIVDKRLDTPSKKLRNIVAGYATRLKKAE